MSSVTAAAVNHTIPAHADDLARLSRLALNSLESILRDPDQSARDRRLAAAVVLRYTAAAESRRPQPAAPGESPGRSPSPPRQTAVSRENPRFHSARPAAEAAPPGARAAPTFAMPPERVRDLLDQVFPPAGAAGSVLRDMDQPRFSHQPTTTRLADRAGLAQPSIPRAP